MARLLITDIEWSYYSSFLKMRTGRPSKHHRQYLNGIFWILRTGSPWRDLPEEFGKWSSVYRQFRRWTLSGTWDAIFDAISSLSENERKALMIDSTVIRAHQHAAGGKKGL